MQALIRPLGPSEGLRVMTYNTLAQSLVRREQFPSSGASLKWTARCSALVEEISTYAPNVLFLQEVDQSKESWWKQLLDRIHLDFKLFVREGKSHGCVVAWDRNRFDLVAQDEVLYDAVPGQEGVPPQTNTGNLALLVKLKNRASNAELVLGTTHLYWHPNADYERLRQLICMLEHVDAFKCPNVILGADFNSTPDSPAYQYLATHRISAEMKADLLESARCRHFGAIGAPEHRRAPSLLRDPELAVNDLIHHADLASSLASQLTSCYVAELGSEPPFTNWTEGFKATLDYIFVSSAFTVKSVLPPVSPEGMPPGLPYQLEKGGYPSDHIPLVADLTPDL